MKLNKKLAALFLVSTCAVSTTLNAQESGLEQLVSTYVKSAVNAVSNDIDNQLEETLVSATHYISFNTEEIVKTKVTITDLADEALEDEKEHEVELNEEENIVD